MPLLFLSCAAGLAPLGLATAAGAATFTVDSTLDGGDSNTADGVCDDGGGNCTLRAAIEQANALAGGDTIEFAIGGGGAQTITLGVDLPIASEALTIDGSTQPGFVGTPLIRIDGFSFAGLQFGAVSSATVTDLDLSKGAPCVFGDPRAIRFSGASNVTVSNLDVSGQGYGIEVTGPGDSFDITGNDLTDSGCSNVGFGLRADNVTNYRASGNTLTDTRGMRLENLDSFTVTDAVPGASTHYLVMEPASGADTGLMTIDLVGVTNSLIENVDVSNPVPCVFGNRIAFRALNSSGLMVQNLDATDRGYGIEITNGDGFDVTGNNLTSSGCSNVGHALKAANTTNYRASGNDLTDARAIRLDDLDNFLVTDAIPGAATHYLVIESTSGADTGQMSLELTRLTNSRVENVDLSNSVACVFGNRRALHADNCTNLEVENVDATDRGYGIGVQRGSDFLITNSDLSGAGCSNVGYGLLAMDGATNYRAHGNTFTNVHTGVRLENVTGFTITNTLAGAPATDFMVLEATSGIDTFTRNGVDLQQADNTLVENLGLANAGACVANMRAVGFDDSDGVTVQGVTATGRGTGVFARRGSNYQVTNNDLSNSCGSALHVEDDPASFSASGNTVGGSNTFLLLRDVTDFLVTDAVPAATKYVALEPTSGVGSGGNNAIHLDQASTTTVEHLRLVGPSTGVLVNGATDVTVDRVTVIDAFVGVSFQNHTNGVLSCSQIRGSSPDGLRTINATNPQAVNNWFQDNSFGVRQLSGGLVDAENNFWGTADGSTTDGGSGDPHGGLVDGVPFLAAMPACVPADLDFGDAPAPYPTFSEDDGARHNGDGADLRIGTVFDNDPDGQPNPGDATGDDTLDSGDDEEGVTFTTPLVLGQAAAVEVVVTDAGTAGLINAWIDWDQNGSWLDAGEQIATDLAVPSVRGSQTVVVNCTVPLGATDGTTYARFRLDSTGGLAPTGLATDGEVEDYEVTVLTAPPAVPPLFSKAFAPDTIQAGQVSTLTFTIDNSANTIAVGDLDFTDPLPAAVEIAAAPLAGTTCTGGTLTAPAAGDTISYSGGAVSAGAVCTVSVDVTSSTPGAHLNTTGDLTSSAGNSGDASDTLTVIELDFGDAPDPLYPTLLASNGASHEILGGFHLGALIDGEPDGQPSGLATGDDLVGSADEDGVTFVDDLITNTTVTVNVTASLPGLLSAWVDFDRDGSWAESPDEILTDEPLGAGVNPLIFSVPADSALGCTGTRFRFSTAGGLSYDGAAADGEVEDHAIEIQPADDLELINRDIDEDGLYRAVLSITAGGDFAFTPDLRVLAPAQVTFQAGDRVVFRNGFFVEDGAELEVVLFPVFFNDCTPLPGQPPPMPH